TPVAGLAGGAQDVTRLEPQVCFHFLYVFYTTDVMNGQCRSTMANASQRRPTQINDGQRRPTKTNAGHRRPRKPTAGQRRSKEEEEGGGARDATRLEPQVCFFLI